MPIPYQRKLIPRAKELRREATLQENHLWYDFLRDYPVRFQRQKTIDSFIADFYCYQAKLIIEVDGQQHFTAQGVEYDLMRTGVLQKYGLEVVRFTNEEIDRQFQFVCTKIDEIVRLKMNEQICKNGI